MDVAYQIFEYLPLQYKNPSDADYFNFLVSSVEQNYQAKNYHFALVALHMIYMGIVYHYIYGIFRADMKRFEYVLIGFHDRLDIKDIEKISWHTFSNENESTIFQFYRAVGFSKSEIATLKTPVKKRNNILHTNGIYISEENDFEEYSCLYLKNLEKIHNYCIDEHKILFLNFLNELNFGMRDTDEAIQYLYEGFIREYGVNIKIINSLFQNINKSQYPKGKKRFYDALKKMMIE